MHALNGKIAVIAGGTGTVGEAIVRVFLEEGATVVVPSRTEDAIARLREYLGSAATERLTTLVGQIGEEAGAERLRDEVLERVGPIDAFVASLGGTWEEKLPLVDVPVETWEKYADSNLKSHYITAPRKQLHVRRWRVRGPPGACLQRRGSE